MARRHRRRNPLPLLPILGVGAVAVVGVVAALALRKKPAAAVSSSVSFELDDDGFPAQAERQFLQDNDLQERRFGPILEVFDPAPVRFTQPSQAQSGPVADVFVPGTTQADNGGAFMVVEEDDDDSFFSFLD